MLERCPQICTTNSPKPKALIYCHAWLRKSADTYVSKVEKGFKRLIINVVGNFNDLTANGLIVEALVVTD